MLLLALAFWALLKLKPRPARPQPKDREGVLHPDDPLYDSFRRHDQYGKLGADPQPMLEYLRLAFLLTTLAPLKFIGAFSTIFGVHVLCRHELAVPLQPSFPDMHHCKELHDAPDASAHCSGCRIAGLLAGRCQEQCRRV